MATSKLKVETDRAKVSELIEEVKELLKKERANSLEPVFAGKIPQEVSPLITRICLQQELISEAIAN